MFRHFREVHHTTEVEETWSNRLDRAAEIASAESDWIPGKNTVMEADVRAKAILETKKAEKIAKAIEAQKPELPKLRVDVERHLEVENTFTQMHVLKSETAANVQQAATTNNADEEPTTKHWHFDDSHERYDERCGETLDVTLNADGSYTIEWNCMCIYEIETITAEEIKQWLNTEEILPDTNGYYGWGPLRGGYKVFGFLFRGKVGHVNMGIIEKLYYELKKK